jgi:hypothetical protein
VLTKLYLNLSPFSLCRIKVAVLHEFAVSDKASVAVSIAEIDASILPECREFFKTRILPFQEIADKGLESFTRIPILWNYCM